MSDNRIDYSKYRYEKAGEDLGAAKLLFDNESHSGANNRAYYCVFHSIRSILVYVYEIVGRYLASRWQEG